MLYRETIAVCSQIHTKHINTLCGQNVELLNVKLVVHIVTTGLQMVKSVLNAPNTDQCCYHTLLNNVTVRTVSLNVQPINIPILTNRSNPQRSSNYHYSLRNIPEERSSPLVSCINRLTCKGDTKGLDDATLNEVIVGECVLFIYPKFCYS
jgi:hypothetical protein